MIPEEKSPIQQAQELGLIHRKNPPQRNFQDAAQFAREKLNKPDLAEKAEFYGVVQKFENGK